MFRNTLIWVNTINSLIDNIWNACQENSPAITHSRQPSREVPCSIHSISQLAIEYEIPYNLFMFIIPFPMLCSIYVMEFAWRKCLQERQNITSFSWNWKKLYMQHRDQSKAKRWLMIYLQRNQYDIKKSKMMCIVSKSLWYIKIVRCIELHERALGI